MECNLVKVYSRNDSARGFQMISLRFKMTPLFSGSLGFKSKLQNQKKNSVNIKLRQTVPYSRMKPKINPKLGLARTEANYNNKMTYVIHALVDRIHYLFRFYLMKFYLVTRTHVNSLRLLKA